MCLKYVNDFNGNPAIEKPQLNHVTKGVRVNIFISMCRRVGKATKHSPPVCLEVLLLKQHIKALKPFGCRLTSMHSVTSRLHRNNGWLMAIIESVN